MEPNKTTVSDLIADLTQYPNDMIITQFYIKIKTKIGNAILLAYNTDALPPFHNGEGTGVRKIKQPCLKQ
jgi:hypothetical protein